MAIKKNESEKQTYLVKCYLTKMEYELLEKFCSFFKMSKSQAVHHFIFEKIGKVPKRTNNRSQRNISEDIIYHLSKIGTNLNQLTHCANIGIVRNHELRILLEDLKSVLQELKGAN